MLEAHNRVMSWFSFILKAIKEGDKASFIKGKNDCELQMSVASGIFYDKKYSAKSKEALQEIQKDFMGKIETQADIPPDLIPLLETYRSILETPAFYEAKIIDDGSRLTGEDMQKEVYFQQIAAHQAAHSTRIDSTNPKDYIQFAQKPSTHPEGLEGEYDFKPEYAHQYKKAAESYVKPSKHSGMIFKK
jgi:hypothetical protein